MATRKSELLFLKSIRDQRAGQPYAALLDCLAVMIAIFEAPELN